MQSKTLALFALSASATLASPFHKRQEVHHHHGHGTGTVSGFRPSGSGAVFPAGNDTAGFFAPTGSAASSVVLTQTVSPLPAGSDAANTFGNVAASSSSSCTTTSIATETSTNLITVTASGADLANTKVVSATGSVSAGAFYGGRGSWSQSASSAAGFTPSSANPSTTLATMPSASKSSAMSGSGAATSASSAASSAASAPSTGSSGGKRGISFNDASLVKAFGSSVSWAYNWGSTESGSLGVEYVPMMWGRDQVSGFASQVGSATHVLSFNEPDLGSQSNIDAATAAQLHNQGMKSLVGKVKIGSPAVTNGAGTMGVGWLDAFFKACGEGACNVDFVAYHWYATADSIDYFKSHTQDVINIAKQYGINKVWLTEFEPSGSADAQAAFMTEAVAFLDSTDAVERYAAFMASDGTMLSGTSLNSVGSAYASA